MIKECLNQCEDCPLAPRRRKSVGHHLYYPSNEYVTELEVAFRNMAENVVQRCVCIENADPHDNPPVKPVPVQMLNALRESHNGHRP